MKNIFRRLIVCLLPVFFLLPPVDAAFSATMPAKTVAQPLLLLLFGWMLSSTLPLHPRASSAPSAVIMATLLILFWMIPRSIDLTQIYPSANALYVLSLFAAGSLLSLYFPLLPGVARTVYALHSSSMIVALGLLYAFQSTLLCSAYTLEDQHGSGWMLVSVGVFAYLLVLASMTRWLAQPAESR